MVTLTWNPSRMSHDSNYLNNWLSVVRLRSTYSILQQSEVVRFTPWTNKRDRTNPIPIAILWCRQTGPICRFCQPKRKLKAHLTVQKVLSMYLMISSDTMRKCKINFKCWFKLKFEQCLQKTTSILRFFRKTKNNYLWLYVWVSSCWQREMDERERMRKKNKWINK